MRPTTHMYIEKGDLVRAQSFQEGSVAVDFLSSDELGTPLVLMGSIQTVNRLLVEAINACSSAIPGGPSVRGISAGEPDEGEQR
ncbi:MAG: hypothetical protein ACREN8_10210 [Candidatus Dormibacteraceae bacterium]